MNAKELEEILLRPASSIMRQEGNSVFKAGLITGIKGKRIEDIYHIYGVARSKTKSQEFNTHITINLSKKKVERLKCSCDDFAELSREGYSFMCEHLTGTAYMFLNKVIKNDGVKAEDNAGSTGKQPSNETARLVRKILKDSEFYEGQLTAGSEKEIIKPEQLRDFLSAIDSRKIRFKYEHLEFTARIFHCDLPLTFTLKERNEFLVLKTHLKFPKPLNSEKDVFLYKNELYLPSKEQIERYLPLFEKLKRDGEILYPKDAENYNRLISLLRTITQDINISEDLRNFMAGFIKPKLYLFKDKDGIYCDVNVLYGNKEINILQSDNCISELVRDYKKEDRIIMDLEKLMFIKKEKRFLFIGGDEELYNILKKRRNSIHSLGTVIMGKGFKGRNIYSSADIEASLQEHEGYFELFYGFKNIENKELNSIFAAYKQNKSFYRIGNNSFIDLEDEDLKGFFHLLEVLNIEESLKGDSLKLDRNKALYLNESIKAREIEFIKGTEALKKVEEKFNLLISKEIPLPTNLSGKLREYQIEGFRWLKTLSKLGLGGILSDEMGLGKTIQTIALVASDKSKKTFIICPTSLIYNWKAEFEKFAPDVRVAVAHGEKNERLKLIDNLSEYDVILTTYGTLRLDISLYKGIVFDYCIIDEGQNIKNSSAQNTRVIKEVKAKVRFALTGTPVENNLTELWSIFDFIMPGYLYTEEIFEKKFIIRGEENKETLKLLIKPFILRRTKREVIKELPDKIEKKFIVQMTSAQRDVYNTYAKYARDKMANASEGRIEIFSYLTKLRQICLEPSLVISDYAGGSGKFKVAVELIKNHIDSGGKVLLFSQFTSVLDKLSENLEKEKIKHLHLNGATKPANRIKMVNEFNNNEELKVFLISLKAGGTGLNLTSANLVIHFDPWWNPAVENQATDRAHRIGQRNIVEVVKLVAKGTIEEKIISLQEDKKNLIDSIITGELQNSNLLNKLSREELLQLFERDNI